MDYGIAGAAALYTNLVSDILEPPMTVGPGCQLIDNCGPHNPLYHLRHSVLGESGPSLAADVLVRTGAGVAAVFVSAEGGLGLAIVDEDELNALEVIPIVRNPIPTLPMWGLVTMTLVLLAAGTLALRTRRPPRKA